MMNANAKKFCWFVGAIVVVLLLSNVEAQNNTTTAMVMPTSTIAPSPTTQVVANTTVAVTPSPPPSPSLSPSPPTPPVVDPPTSSSTPQPPPTTLPLTPTPTPTSTPTSEPPTTVLGVSRMRMKITLEIKFMGNEFDNATNGKTSEGNRLRFELCLVLTKKYEKVVVLSCIIFDVKIVNSVIVKYELIINATSRDQAQKVVDAIQKQVNTGMIGNYTVDAKHPVGAKITMLVTVDGNPPTTEEPTVDPKTLIILLGVGLGLLVLVIVLLIVLIAKLRNKVHS